MEVMTFKIKINHVIVCLCVCGGDCFAIGCSGDLQSTVFPVLSMVTAGSRDKTFTRGLSKMTEA